MPGTSLAQHHGQAGALHVGVGVLAQIEHVTRDREGGAVLMHELLGRNRVHI